MRNARVLFVIARRERCKGPISSSVNVICSRNGCTNITPYIYLNHGVIQGQRFPFPLMDQLQLRSQVSWDYAV